MFRKLEKMITLAFIVGFSLFFLCPTGEAATYPTKPVTIIVTADAGGGEDTGMRGVAPFLQKHLGVSVLIENMGGAGGKIAFEKFMKTKPDGYTLIFQTFPKSVIIEMTDKVSFVTREYTPVYVISSSYNGLMVHADTWKTFDEFLKAAKAKNLESGTVGAEECLPPGRRVGRQRNGDRGKLGPLRRGCRKHRLSGRKAHRLYVWAHYLCDFFDQRRKSETSAAFRG